MPDVVIYGIGFAKNYDMFDKVVQERLSVSIFAAMSTGSEVSTVKEILTQAICPRC